MQPIFRTTFRGARRLGLVLVFTLALGGAAYAVVTTNTASDFSLSPSVTTATTSPGGTVGYGINLQATGGFSDNVTLSATGLPAGATASFGSNPAFVDASLASASTLWINTSSSSPTGPSTITITGTPSSGPAHSTTVTLNMVGSGIPDYAIQMTPTTQYVQAGGSVTYDVKIIPVNAFVGNVTLSAMTVPGAILLGWNGNTPTTAQNPTLTVAVGGANPGTATLTVATTQTNPPGSYAVSVTGTSGNLAHTTAGDLDIDLFSATGSTSAAITPGASAQPISVNVKDPYNYGVTITGLAASVAQDSAGNVINASGNVVPHCLASWFKFTDSPLSSNTTFSLGAGSTVPLPATDDPKIAMVDAPNQDACKGAQLKLNFVGSAQK
jgi:hypothetical protein